MEKDGNDFGKDIDYLLWKLTKTFKRNKVKWYRDNVKVYLVNFIFNTDFLFFSLFSLKLQGFTYKSGSFMLRPIHLSNFIRESTLHDLYDWVPLNVKI